jgi:hypothetical protein
VEVVRHDRNVSWSLWLLDLSEPGPTRSEVTASPLMRAVGHRDVVIPGGDRRLATRDASPTGRYNDSVKVLTLSDARA